MVPSPRRPCALAAMVAVTLGVAPGCSRLTGPGPTIPGVQGKISLPRTPPARTSTYEVTPAVEWSRYAMGRPYVPGFFFSDHLGPGPAPCRAAPQGLTRVLPVTDATPSRDLLRLGPVGAGVAGAPVAPMEEMLGVGGGGLTAAMLERSSLLADDDPCAANVFAYVRLGLGAADDPVAVMR